MTLITESKVANLDGLVLLGGKSSRMKSPKAFLTINQSPLWRSSQEALSSVCQQVLFSVSPNLEQMPPVAEALLVHDIFKDPAGPLGGIISGFKRNLSCGYFVLACDLPNFTQDAAKELVARRNHKKLATVFTSKDGQVEPLCGIYEPAIFQEIMGFWARGVYCPRKILSQLDVERVAPKNYSWIDNLNHAHQYAAIVEKDRNTNEPKTIKVSYYASMKEHTGCSHESVNTRAHTVGDLFSEVKERYGFDFGLEQLRLAKNDGLVGACEPVAHNDSVVFIPPVSGG